MTNKPKLEESEVARCRRVRDDLDREFKSADEALKHLSQLERKQKRTVAQSSRGKSKRPRSTSAAKSTIHS